MSTVYESLKKSVVPIPAIDNTCAVVVTYQPDSELPDRLVSIREQVDRLYLVDNGSNEEAYALLQRLADESSTVELVANDTNLGIAVALNQGAEAALEQGYDWLLMFDQDSTVETGLFTALAAIYRQQVDCGRIGVIGSNYWHAATGQIAYNPARDGSASVNMETVITSGSLLSLHAFQEVGKFREELFIDSVDNEYCLRLRARGLRVLLSTRPLMHHPMGQQKRYWLFGRRPSCTHYGPARHYYLTRNRLTVMREWYARRPAWVWGECKAFFVALLMLLLYEEQKFKKLCAVALGIWHALRGRLGPLSRKLDDT